MIKKTCVILGIIALAMFNSCNKGNLPGKEYGPEVTTVHVSDTLHGKRNPDDKLPIPIYGENSDPAEIEYSNWRENFFDSNVIRYADLYVGSSLFTTYYVPFLYCFEYDKTTTTVNDYDAGYLKAKSEYRNIKCTRIFDRSVDMDLDDWNSDISYGIVTIHQSVEYYDVNLNDPSIVNDVSFTHSDIVGDWYIMAYIDDGDDGDDDETGSGTGSERTPPGDHTGDSRYLSYLGSTTGYYESGKDIKTVKLYVYCEQGLPSAIRVSPVEGNSYGFIIKTATHKVYSGLDPWGMGCNKYYTPLGITTYFKWK